MYPVIVLRLISTQQPLSYAYDRNRGYPVLQIWGMYIRLKRAAEKQTAFHPTNIIFDGLTSTFVTPGSYAVAAKSHSSTETASLNDHISVM